MFNGARRDQRGRNSISVEIEPSYVELAAERIQSAIQKHRFSVNTSAVRGPQTVTTYRLLDRFRALFERIKYEHRKSTHGDKVAVCLYEDLLALGESATLIRGIKTRKLVVNAQNRRVGVRARRGDGTFGRTR